jgi:uncharacterized repeat protein (TIGR03803 family)
MDALSLRNLKSSPHLLVPTKSPVLALAIVLAFAIIATPAAQAQTYTVLHYFLGQGDGTHPSTGLTIDAAGNLYGTTSAGGPGENGTVFKLKRSGSGWTLNTLYGFGGGGGGNGPEGRVALAKDGILYGTTAIGGGSGCLSFGCGTVFRLTPPPSAPKSASAPWNEAVIYGFDGADGFTPQGDLTFDRAGNIYGTTLYGGSSECNNSGLIGCGTVYELTPSGSGWGETVLYAPQDGSDGTEPIDGVVFDASGNLYGEFQSGGPFNWGLIYKLSPSGSGWTEQTAFDFSGGNNGGVPHAGMIFDPSSGNLYGTTFFGGSGGCGTVFQLTPANGGWTLNTIYGFTGAPGGCNPQGKLVMDADGNLYGTTFYGGAGGGGGNGTVFKLTPANGGWTYTQLYAFNGDLGAHPMSSLVFDAAGNLLWHHILRRRQRCRCCL